MQKLKPKNRNPTKISERPRAIKDNSKLLNRFKDTPGLKKTVFMMHQLPYGTCPWWWLAFSSLKSKVTNQCHFLKKK